MDVGQVSSGTRLVLFVHFPPMVQHLGPDRRDEVVEVLVKSFWTYPTMAYMLGNNGDHDIVELTTLIGMFVDGRYGRDSPVLGVDAENQLAAIALVDYPARRSAIEPYRSRMLEALALLGEDVEARIDAFSQASADFEPKAPHYYIGMLGVLPEFQGQGLARTLVNEVVFMSEADDESESVCLTTEAEGNLAIYQALGFGIVGDITVN